LLIAASDANRGIAMYRQRQFEAAEAEFTRVLARSPKDTTARLYLARTLVELRRIPQALAEVERVLAGNATRRLCSKPAAWCAIWPSAASRSSSASRRTPRRFASWQAAVSK